MDIRKQRWVTLYVRPCVTEQKSTIMPRLRHTVRATALVCLVLGRSYVSNSASPAAYSTYWRRAFALPSTFVRRSCGHVSVRRCAGLYLSGTVPVRWRHHSRVPHPDILPAQSIYIYRANHGYTIKINFTLAKHDENTSVNMAWYPREILL